MTGAEHRAALLNMAETWESLAREREARIARETNKETEPDGE